MIAGRPAANLKRSRGARFVLLRGFFVLVVGLSLTIVCQGHQHTDHYSDAHVTLLGEPDDGADLQAASPQGPNGLVGVDAPAKPLELTDLAGLGFVLLITVSGAAQVLQRLRRAGIVGKSQVIVEPQPPPPEGRVVLRLITVSFTSFMKRRDKLKWNQPART